MLHRGPTIANLRKLLAPYVPEAEIIDHARQLREAGLIPAGKPGRAGVGSAQLDARQAALLLIALMCRGPTIGIAAEVVRVGGFKLRGRLVYVQEEPQGRYFQHYLAMPSPPTFLDFIEKAIEAGRGALPEGLPPTVVVGQGIAFDEAMAQVPAALGGGKLVFTPDDPGKPRPAITTERAIAGRLIAGVAALFEPVEPEEISPALLAWVGAALNLSTALPGRADA
jgi:hypothetical protein